MAAQVAGELRAVTCIYVVHLLIKGCASSIKMQQKSREERVRKSQMSLFGLVFFFLLRTCLHYVLAFSFSYIYLSYIYHTYIFISDNISILMSIMCVILCLFSTLSRMVGALQISIIIIISSVWSGYSSTEQVTCGMQEYSFLILGR